MKKIALVVHEDAVLSSISCVLDLFAGTNQILAIAGKPAAFEVELVGERSDNIRLEGHTQLVALKTFEEVSDADLIIATAFLGDVENLLSKNQAAIAWIKEMSGKGVEVASLCVGSYFLAEAGLLSGKTCTSHWMAIDDMKKRYPDAEVLSDMVLTDHEGVYTSGGAFSSLNLILYLIEKFCGRAVCIPVSKMFSIDMDRVSQAHFAVFKGQRRHEDEVILKAQTYIEQNYHTQISIDQVADQTHMSKRNFIRRFKSATQNTPLEYIQRVKIESAKKALESSSQDIANVMYDSGYNDMKTFRGVFKRITGLTPQDYRKKYSRSGAIAA